MTKIHPPAPTPQPTPWSSRLIVPAFVLGIGSFMGILVIDLVVGPSLDADGESAMLLGVRLVLGLLSAGTAIAVGAWIVSRDPPPSLQGDDAHPLTTDGHRFARATADQNSGWFIRMRWVAIAVALTLVVLAVRLTSVIIPEAMWPLLTIVALLALANILYPRLAASDRLWKANIPIQVVVDLLLLVALLHFAGGVENPVSVLLVLHVIIGGVLLGRAWCYTVAGVASLLYAALIWGEWLGWLAHYPLGVSAPAQSGVIGLEDQAVYVAGQTALHAAMLLVVALFVGTLGERARSNEARLRSFAETALAGHRLLKQAIETTNTAIRVIDRDMQPTLINTRWQAWSGRLKPDPSGHPIAGLDGPAVLTLRDGQTRVSQLTIPPEPGEASDSYQTIRLTTAALGHHEGRVEQVVQLAQDITELSRHHEQMVRASQLAAVGELAGKVAHEVNNPIAIISAKARLLVSDHRDELTERTASELNKIIELSDRVAHIAQGLLYSCRPPHGACSSVDLCPLVRDAISLIEAHAKSVGVTIEADLSGPPVGALVNPGQMQQVVLNILLNAIDAMPKGGTLRICCRPEADSPPSDNPPVTLIIDDSGPGIDPAIRERVFEPFFSTKPAGDGSGLGLSICRGIVRSFSGDIEISDAPIGGARITICVPCESTPGGPSSA